MTVTGEQVTRCTGDVFTLCPQKMEVIQVGHDLTSGHLGIEWKPPFLYLIPSFEDESK